MTDMEKWSKMLRAFAPTAAAALNRELRLPWRDPFKHVENMNWHFQNDGALKGLKVMHPVGGGVSHFWNYTAQCWELLRVSAGRALEWNS